MHLAQRCMDSDTRFRQLVRSLPSPTDILGPGDPMEAADEP